MFNVKVRVQGRSGGNPTFRLSNRFSQDTLERAGQFAVQAARENLSSTLGNTGLSGDGGGASSFVSSSVNRGRHSNPVAYGYRHRATDATHNSINYSIDATGMYPRLTVTAGGNAHILNFGRQPNRGSNNNSTVLTDEIRKWAEKKQSQGMQIGGNTDFEGFVYLVTRNVAKRGMAPTYFFTDAIDALREEIKRGGAGAIMPRRQRGGK